MPTLSLGGQTLATQTGSDGPTLSPVSFHTDQVFPTGHVIQTVQVVKNDSEVLPCLLYTSPSPRDRTRSRMPSSA